MRNRFQNYLSKNGMRQTSGRFKILEKCADQKASFTIQALYEDLKGEYYVSLASVYQTIELLCDCNILRKHYLHENEASYELAGDANIHLICLECGAVFVQKIHDSEDAETMRVQDLIDKGEFSHFRPAFVTTHVYGLCPSCRAKVN